MNIKKYDNLFFDKHGILHFNFNSSLSREIYGLDKFHDNFYKKIDDINPIILYDNNNNNITHMILDNNKLNNINVPSVYQYTNNMSLYRHWYINGKIDAYNAIDSEMIFFHKRNTELRTDINYKLSGLNLHKSGKSRIGELYDYELFPCVSEIRIDGNSSIKFLNTYNNHPNLLLDYEVEASNLYINFSRYDYRSIENRKAIQHIPVYIKLTNVVFQRIGYEFKLLSYELYEIRIKNEFDKMIPLNFKMKLNELYMSYDIMNGIIKNKMDFFIFVGDYKILLNEGL